MTPQKHRLYTIWSKVPPDYYQKGVRSNVFQWVWHRIKISNTKKLLQKINFNSCLDIGCASGYMLSEITKAYPKAEYFGIDVYDKAITLGKKLYPRIHFRVASADKIPSKNNSFDLILFYETIEHVEDPMKSLKEIRRVMKKGGHLILAMDSGNLLFRTIWFFWEKTLGRVWGEAHLHPFHHLQLEQLLRSAGFKIKQKLFTHLGMEVVFVLSK